MRLGQLIREHQEHILTSWEEVVRSLSSASQLPRPALLDHMPMLLDWLAERLESPFVSFPHEQALEHAQERINEGYDLSDVISEYAVLRDTLLELWENTPQANIEPREIRLLDQALDDLIAFTAVFYARTRLFGETLIPPAPGPTPIPPAIH